MMIIKRIIKCVIKIQKKYRDFKLKIKELDNLISFQREYLISMINNLSFLNNIKLYQDIDSLFLTILNELLLVKKEIDLYPEYINIKNFKEFNIKSIEINELLIKY